MSVMIVHVLWVQTKLHCCRWLTECGSAMCLISWSFLHFQRRCLWQNIFRQLTYIVKLTPKQKGATHWLSSGMNSGIQGNVAMYKLNTEDIIDTMDARIMPPAAKILASIIGVIIIGPKNMPE